MDEKKSAAYKKLVEDMQKKYPEYHDALQPTDTDRQRAQNFFADFVKKFATHENFLEALKYRCAKWEKSDDVTVNDKRALESLTLSIANGYDPKDSVALFASPVANEICHEINLYTYWQGLDYAEKTPKIKYLLVAQDWGNGFEAPAIGIMERVKKINADKNITYLDRNIECAGTDKNLMELFKILGYNDIFTRHDELFFTNFCLGYRLGKESGGMTKKLMMHDAELFKELCDILEPENILCLGKLASECAYEALNGERTWKKIYGGFANYNDFIAHHPDIKVRCGRINTRFYPLAHCGQMGTMTRCRNTDKKIWQKNPLILQQQDWKRIFDDNN